MHKRFQELLHRFKIEEFHAEHNKTKLEDVTRECLHVTEEVLDTKYEYHFHKLPDADRAEIINMINNYTREALLPPVVEKLVTRQLLLEKKVEHMFELNRQILELLSQEPAVS